MRSRLKPLIVIAAFAASSNAASAYSGATMKTAALHAAPSDRSPVVAMIPANAPIDIGPCRAYCLVSYGDLEGYVAASLILAEAPAPRAPQHMIGPFGLVF
jgi:uncharacterized protein YraI